MSSRAQTAQLYIMNLLPGPLCRLGLDVPLFTRLQQDAGLPSELLEVQYRMHPTISAWPSQRFYESLLRNGVRPADRPLVKVGWHGGESDH